MKKLKLGTRVLVNGVETFVSELHADIERGVYKVRTSNPTYEFTKNSKGVWWAYPCEGQEAILLEEAPKYGNYQVGDRVTDKKHGNGVVKHITDTEVVVEFPEYHPASLYPFRMSYTLSGQFSTIIAYRKNPVLKKLRVKLGEKR